MNGLVVIIRTRGSMELRQLVPEDDLDDALNDEHIVGWDFRVEPYEPEAH